MANLRTNKITSTEVFETTGSVQFDGSGDYLSLSSNDEFDFGFGSFTIEAWVYPKNLTSDILIATSNSTGGFFFGRRNSGSYIGYGRLGTAWDNSSGNDLIINQWNHVAVCRESNNNIRVFLNGIQSGPTQSLSTSYNLNTLTIGGTTSEYYINGHISNLRILKGTALYTENFTPPTRELEVIPNTVLLCAQSKTRANEEKTGKTITVNGNAVANELTPGLLTNVVKSGGSSAITGSVEFDGNGDYFSFASSSDFTFGTGDFTIEFWMRRTDTGNNVGLLDNRSSVGDSNGWFIRFNSSNTIQIVENSNIYTTSTFGPDWSHVAFVRRSGVITSYINGIATATANVTKNYTSTSLLLGGFIDTQSSPNAYQGYISNLRIIKGTALYTSNFIPPTRKLTKIPGTVLLCCTDTNNPTAEATGKTITGYGDLQKADGLELITNGTFDTNTTGWTAFESTNTWSSGKMQITRTSGGGRSTYQTFTTVPGYVYTITSEVNSVGSRGDVYILYGTGWTNIDNPLLYLAGTNGQTRILSGHFTAISTTTTLAFAVDVGGTSIIVDNVSVSLRNPGPKQPFVPQVGNDGSVEFAGPTKINTPNYFYLPTGSTEQRGRGRGVFGGGEIAVAPSFTNAIDYIQIQSTGNATDFGDLTAAKRFSVACSSVSRGVFGGGNNPGSTNVIEYITISNTANSLDFGDLIALTSRGASCSNSTRGLFGGGYSPNSPTLTNAIDYITIASTGNSLDFGDLTQARFGPGAFASPTRGVFFGGSNVAAFLNIIEYVTIASTGSAFSFGNIASGGLRESCGCSSPTRGVYGSGYTPALSNTLEYITIASTGNGTDFGDLTVARTEVYASTSNSIRGLWAGGQNPGYTNIIDYVTIASIGNALDFGDLIRVTNGVGACSDSHGGLG